MKLQDRTRTAGPAAPDTLAMMAWLARLSRAEVPQLGLGIIVEAHDPAAALSDESQPVAAGWTARMGADGLIVTGSYFADSCARIEAVRTRAPDRPVLIAGGVTEANVAAALAAADGVIVSSALMQPEAGEDDLLRWDAGRCRRFMDAARAAA